MSKSGQPLTRKGELGSFSKGVSKSGQPLTRKGEPGSSSKGEGKGEGKGEPGSSSSGKSGSSTYSVIRFSG